MNYSKSISAFDEAKQLIPGGVNSPVRAFKSVQADPLFIAKAKGARVWDIDDNEYIDFVSSWGPLILGHANPAIVEAVQKAAELGTSYGAPTLIETEMAKLITEMVPSVEKVRMVNSGTEATMSALRLARGYTKRDLVIKFAGCYHGHADSFLIKAGSGAITLGLPDSPGVTKASAQNTLTAEYNNLDSVKELFEARGEEIAAVIVEPVAGNMGCVLPNEDFLKGLREITKQYGALLIFDEVITGFRLSAGGAQKHFGVMPDLTTLGKIIGGGLPVGAYGGSKEIMDMLAPNGPVYQAGTLSGNPLAMAAGSVMLRTLNDNPSIYKELDRKGAKVEAGLMANLEKAGIPGIINRIGSMMTLFFTEEKEVKSFDQAMKSNAPRYAKFFKKSLESGIYLGPSQYECFFVSDAHTDEDLEYLLEANEKALKSL
ncbi:glutamate-1-semialdehyde 2,1-aminomutase [Mangrovibacterium lignilyticum]|uniref:glutamate-1-semialdehyde 2,1-aminomutase n=1 Tax=Mangrovibacterium lignilyticum TaxID=2668052 RepID=UPI0013D17923|nr:glutamate-1-semialdehyde 2,1-aminomutase [Mangrovibacterium lignilyticum]